MNENEKADEQILEMPPQQDISSIAAGQQEPDIKPENVDIAEAEKVLTEDAVKIQNLLNAGIINPQQGQYYLSQLAQKSFEIDRLKKDMNSQVNPINPMQAFNEFEKENPDFFLPEGRMEVLEYLKNSKVLVDKDEISLISQMVEKLEKNAIERYLKQQAHDKALNNENEAAKKRLTANAQNAASYGNKNRVFTRAQIGKMSGAEFTKYEPMIMEQLRKGLIH